MTFSRPLACLLLVGAVMLAAAACARRTEIIGRLPDGAVGDGPVGDGPMDVPLGVEASPPEGGAGDAPDGSSMALCPAPAPQPAPPEPVWNCGPGCWRHDQIDQSVFAAPPRPAPGQPPGIVYPIPNSVHPTNLARITVHWRRAIVEQTSFRLRFEAGFGVAYDFLVPHAAPVGGTPFDQLDSLFAIPDAMWRFIEYRLAGSVVTLTITAHDSLANVVDVSRPVPIRFARGPVEGGLYYLTTEPPGRGIQRHLFGSAQVQPLVRPGVEPYSFDCGGCHSTSRDGRVLAFAATYAGNLALASTNRVLQPIVRPGTPDDSRALAPAVSPNGLFVVARHKVDRSVSVFRTDTGERIGLREPSFLGGRIDFPAWSPNGTELVATRTSLDGQPDMPQSARDGDLVILPFDGNNLGAPQMLLSEPSTYVNSYPSWSPDGKWIVFTSSPAGSETSLNRQTRLRLINLATRNVRDLTNATFGLDRGSKFARFAPTGLDGCQMVFIVFQSGLDYGVLRKNAVDWLQLWMSAIDLASAGSDPSSPPVWLPFQDPAQKNLLPAWSDFIPCDAGCGTGASCDNSRTPARCVPN